jgi:hypothetical protein
MKQTRRPPSAFTPSSVAAAPITDGGTRPRHLPGLLDGRARLSWLLILMAGHEDEQADGDAQDRHRPDK